MPCIDKLTVNARLGPQRLALPLLMALAACSTSMPPPAPPPAPHRATPPAAVAAPAAPQRTAPAPAPVAAPALAGTVALPAPGPVRSMEQVRMQAARRLVAAHPTYSYTGRPPDLLLAAPVLEIELNADGSVRGVDVMRHPSQARDTTQLAIDAVRRAAPYGDVSRLPRPWKFVETFLFDDQRRFKPRILDQ